MFKSKTSNSNSLDKSSNHSRGSRRGKSKSRSKATTTTTPRMISINSFLKQDSKCSNSSTPPLDEISVSSGMSSHSNATELSMNSRSSSSRVNSLSKLPHNHRHRHGSSPNLPRQHSQRSAVSHTSSTCGSMLNEAAGTLDHNSIIIVSQLWEKVKLHETYREDVAEQCILRMLELDPSTRKKLRMPSLRSPRFDEISKIIIYILENIIALLGPDLEDILEELYSIGELCAKEGIQPRLFGEATAAGVAHLVDDFRPEKKQAWKSTFDFLATKMNESADFY